MSQFAVIYVWSDRNTNDKKSHFAPVMTNVPSTYQLSATSNLNYSESRQKNDKKSLFAPVMTNVPSTYQLFATSNLNYSESRQKNGFHFHNLVFMLNLILYITHTSGRAHDQIMRLLLLSVRRGLPIIHTLISRKSNHLMCSNTSIKCPIVFRSGYFDYELLCKQRQVSKDNLTIRPK